VAWDLFWVKRAAIFAVNPPKAELKAIAANRRNEDILLKINIFGYVCGA